MHAKDLPPSPSFDDEPLISVIVPVFQGERLIEGAVRSVLSQSYRNLEVIVVDDGSTDATLVKIQKLANPRLRVITQKNAGTAAARNAAIEVARRYADGQATEAELTAARVAASSGGHSSEASPPSDRAGRVLRAAFHRRARSRLLSRLCFA